MRIIEEMSVDGIKLSIYGWNMKYILKFETQYAEQVYKIPEMEVGSYESLKEIALQTILPKAKATFAQMDQTLDSVYELL